MERIISQRSLSGFYGKMVSRTLFFTIMAILMLSLNSNAINIFGQGLMILMGLGLLYMAGYAVVRLYKNAPLFKVNPESLTVSDAQIFFWNDLERVKFTGKQHFKFLLFGEEKECLQLKFKDQNELFFYDDIYSNTSEVKMFIKQAVINKEPFESIDHVKQSLNQSSVEERITYKGYQLLSFEGIFIWVCIAAFTFCLIKAFTTEKDIIILKIMTLPLIFFFSILSQRMYYFELSNNSLIARNPLLFWKKDTYLINDIQEIVFEQRYKMPVGLRVITNNFESKVYLSATIWSKKWMQLKEDLEKKNIKVRNECVFYEPFEFKLFN